jgi:L-histidine N-alpha-methyltransferase
MGRTDVAVHLHPAEARASLERDTRAGLTAAAKWLPPVWFYDERGSRLFDEITRLPEYYPTRTERSILAAHAGDMAASLPFEALVELGSGTSEKTRLLLDALLAAGRLSTFVPFDVSEEVLREAADAIDREYPSLEVRAVVGDFRHHLDRLPRPGPRLLAFLGGTIGNFAPDQRAKFLFDVDANLDQGEAFLLGTDLVKDPARLVAAYDDAAGVTAEFNRNVLVRLNRELGATFDVEAFQHVAVWNAEEAWIEMRLRSARAQTVTIAALDLEVRFAAGEDLLTEISAKFTPARLEAELWEAGLVVQQAWTDPARDFQLTLATPYC